FTGTPPETRSTSSAGRCTRRGTCSVSLDDLYREVILDHYSHPRNKGSLEPADATGEGANPLCGDEIRLWLIVRAGVVQDVRFDGKGCAISQASASMMTGRVQGRPVEEAGRVIAALEGVSA